MAKKTDLEKAIDEMAIVSNALFSNVFDGRPDRAKFLVKDVLNYLGYKDFEVISSKTQVRKNHLLQHDTITDIEVRLESGEQIIIEVQVSHPERFSPNRGRYVLASNDIASLQEGMDYSDLPPQILIVISEKDLTSTGLPITKVRRYHEETGQLYEDNQTIVLINKENVTDSNTPINQYINDLFEPDYEKVINPEARKILEDVKVNKEGRMQYEGLLQEIIDNEIKEYKKSDLENKRLIHQYQESDLENKRLIHQYKESELARQKELDELKKKYLDLEIQNKKLEKQLSKQSND